MFAKIKKIFEKSKTLYKSYQAGGVTNFWRQDLVNEDSFEGYRPYAPYKQLKTLRARATNFKRNYPVINASHRILKSALTSTNLNPIFKHKNKAFQKRLKQAWKEYSENRNFCDYYGDLNWRGLVKNIVSNWLERGEIFVMPILEKEKSNFENKEDYYLKLKLIDADLVPGEEYPFARGGGSLGKSIGKDEYLSYGVIFRKGSGKKVAYYVSKVNPTDYRTPSYSLDYIRIPKDKIFHVFEKQHSNSFRGIPEFASVFVIIKMLEEYSRQEVLAKREASMVNFVISGQDDDLADADTPGKALFPSQMKPGQIINVGQRKVDLLASKNTQDFSIFVEEILNFVSAGTGIPKSRLTTDRKAQSYSSSKADQIDFHENLDDKFDTLEGCFLRPFVLEWLKLEQLKYPIKDRAKFKDLSFSFTKPPVKVLEHLKNANAKGVELRYGLTSLFKELEAKGLDPEEAIEELKEVKDLLNKFGLRLDSDPDAIQKSGAEQPSTVQDQMTPKEDSEDDKEDDKEKEDNKTKD